jgi:hypothetical protein
VECDPFLTTTSALINDSLITRVRDITHRGSDSSCGSDGPEDSTWLVGIALGNNAAAESQDADRTAQRMRDLALRLQTMVN